MAVPLAADDLLTVRLLFASPNTPVAMNVLHYQVANVSGGLPNMNTVLSTIASNIFTGFVGPWTQAASEGVDFVGVEAQDVFPLPRSNSIRYTPAEPVAGTIAGDALPLQDSATILKMTDFGARWGRGRFFFVGLGEGSAEDGKLGLITRTNLAAVAAWLDNTLSVAGTGWTVTLNPVIISGPEDNPTRITRITECRLSDDVIKSQKRRRPGKGI